MNTRHIGIRHFSRLMGGGARSVVTLAMLLVPLGVLAQDPAPFSISDCAPCTPVDDSRLASQRGGFDLGAGLQVSFGIERATYVNGRLVAEQAISIPDLSRVSAAQAQGLMNMLGSSTLINNGSVTMSSPGLPGSVPGTVIQNNLDAQTIRNLTVLNASSNSLQTLRGAVNNAALRDALISPLIPR